MLWVFCSMYYLLLILRERRDRQRHVVVTEGVTGQALPVLMLMSVVRLGP